MRTTNPTLSVLVIGLCLVSPACSPTPSAPPQLRQVRLRLDWTPWAPHAAFYAAEKNGYFKQEGLTVKMYVPPDPEVTIQLVANGQDQFGISYMTDTILAREQGFRVVSVGALVNHPLNCIMTLKKSGITKPADLKGKVIGTTGVPSDQAFLEWVLSHNGVAKGDVTLVNIGFNLAQALKSGRVHAVLGAYWPWEGIKMEEDGYPVNILKLQDYRVPDYYELILITREDLAARDPSLVRSFLKAAARGQAFVREHPDEAVQILAQASPDLKAGFLTESLRAMLPLMQFPGLQFEQDQTKWSEMITFMHTAGLLKSPVDASAVFTNKYLQ